MVMGRMQSSLWPRICGWTLLLLIARVAAGVPAPLPEPADAIEARSAAMLRRWRSWCEDLGPRAPGMPGNLAIENTVMRHFADSGFEHGALEFEAPAFVPGATRLELEDGAAYALLPMHPTLMRPGNFSSPQVETRLVYLGNGTPEDLARVKGVPLEDSLLVMEFGCGERWLDLLRFGPKGVVFLSAPDYRYADATAKVYNSEVPTPRFFADESLTTALRKALDANATPQAVVTSEPSLWRNQALRNPWVIVPGSDPELARDVVLFTAPIDANSVVPDLAYGGDGVGNLMMLIDLLDHWSETPPRRSVMLVAVNAHTQAYLGERMLAWHLLADMQSITDVRDLLAREMRVAALFAEKYRQLRLEPVDLPYSDLSAALDVFWALFGDRPAADPDTIDDESILRAIGAASERIRGRMRGIMARLTLSDEVRDRSEESLRHLESWRDKGPQNVRELLHRAISAFGDEQLLEDWRAAMDTSTGVRLAVKSRLQETVQRELNIVKMAQMDVSRDGESVPGELDELSRLRVELTQLLVLFNKIDIGRGRERVRYRNIASIPERRELLAGYRDRLLGELDHSVERFGSLLRQDTANGELRVALGTRRVRLAISLGMDWSADYAGFMALNRLPRNEWYRRLGNVAVQAAEAAGEWPDADLPPPYVDALSGVGGLPQETYFVGFNTPAGLFQAAGGVPSLTLRSAFTAPRRAFTPRNRLDELDAQAVYPRFRWMSDFLAALVDEPDLTARDIAPELPVGGNDRLWSCLLRTFEMDEFAAKPTPSLPVPDASITAYSMAGQPPPIVGGDVVNVFMALGDRSGHAMMYGLWESPLAPLAYSLDEHQAGVIAAIDKGRVQESRQMDSNLYRTRSKTLPMFRATEFVIPDRVDTSLLGSRPVRLSELRPISGRSKSDPQKYGVHGVGSLSRASSHSSSGPAAVYSEFKPRRGEIEPLIILTGNMRFAVNPQPDEPEGAGYETSREIGHDFFRKAADDMDRVTRHRVDNMPGIVNELVDEFLELGRAQLDKADRAAQSADYSAYRKAVAMALGSQVKAYEQVRSMNADMLKAILIYMALMMPFCFFLQKLIFSFSRMEHELGVFAVLFVITYSGFRLIHPAFAIAMSPEAIFLAFVLGAVGCFVVWMLHNRFSAEMDLLFRGVTGFTGEAAAGFVGQTAMLIGVNNMKRRRTRTALTTATIVLVVFTMLAFSSVSRRARPTLVQLTPDATYTGLFFTWPGGAAMDEDTPRVFETLFADRADILVRRVLQPAAGPPGSIVRWRLERADDPELWVSVTAAQSLSMRESSFVGPLPVSYGREFNDDNADEIMLPLTMAEALNIDEEDVGGLRVRFLGRELTVVGVLDDDRYRMLRDLDPRFSLLPQALRAADELDAPADDAAMDVGVAGLDLSTLVFLPLELCRLLGGNPVTVSVRMPDDEDGIAAARSVWEEADRLLHATGAAFSIGSLKPFRLGEEAKRDTDAGVYRVTGAYRTTIGGLARLVVPLLIAGLILFNTMLGTVYERKSEIAIYNAIGLNPHHIFAFFLAEALVYGVIGAIGGYLIGQILAILAQTFNLVRGMNVNFSSLMVVWAILFTVGLVLLSTVYPAFVATRTAVPSGTRRWSLPPHDGERMALDLPFIYEPRLVAGVMAYLHEHFEACVDESLGEMLVTPRDRRVEKHEGHPEYHAEYGIALAPYDLGVTQSLHLRACYQPALESYHLYLDIKRESGQDTSWAALNQPLLERLRKMLLRWRNMDPSQHGDYIAMGKKLFEE